MSIEWFVFPSILVPNHPDYTSYTFLITYQDETILFEDDELGHAYVRTERDEVRDIACSHIESDQELYEKSQFFLAMFSNTASAHGSYSTRQIERIVKKAKSIIVKNTTNT